MNRHQTRAAKATDKPMHFFLIAAKIIFRGTENEPIQALEQNTLVVSDDGKLNTTHLARAQQGAQAVFLQKMNGLEGVQIVDVVILGIMPMGLQTQEQFYRKAEMEQLKAQVDRAMKDAGIQPDANAAPDSIPTEEELTKAAEDRPMDPVHKG